MKIRSLTGTTPLLAAALVSLALGGCPASSSSGSLDGGVEGEGEGEHPIALLQPGGAEVGAGGTYFTPLNADNNKVALFSEQKDGWTLHNTSGAAVTINSVTVAVDEGAMPEEWTLLDYGLTPQPLAIADQVLEPDARIDFYLRYYPVAGELSGCTVTVTYDGNKHYSFHVAGKGRPEGQISQLASLDWEKVYGGVNDDVFVSGGVVDAGGNLYFTGHATGVLNGFGSDLVLGRVNSDGALGWAKVWTAPNSTREKDPGQNGETGGSQGSIAIDAAGDIYVAAEWNTTASGPFWQGLILKVSGANGALLWAKLWGPIPNDNTAKASAEAYALTVANGRVYAVGTTGSGLDQAEAHAWVAVLDAGTGALLGSHSIEINASYNDRAYAVAAIPGQADALYLGGNGNGRAWVGKLTGVGQPTVAIAWLKQVELGIGGNINGLVADAQGNVYLSCDRRGAQTYFSAASLDAAGNLRWGKTVRGTPSDSNNTNGVYLHEGRLIVTGRIGLQGYDSQMGDGMVLALDAAAGTPAWSLVHYSAQRPDTMAEHRVKAVQQAGNSLYLTTQVYTGTYNGVRYTGYWYDGATCGAEINDEAFGLTDLSGQSSLIELPNAQAYDPAIGQQWLDAPASLVFQDATAKHDGVPPDGDFLLTKMTLQ